MCNWTQYRLAMRMLSFLPVWTSSTKNVWIGQYDIIGDDACLVTIAFSLMMTGVSLRVISPNLV